MKTFRCGNCGFQVERPAQPYSCPNCGRQAVGLFKVVQGGAQPARPAGPVPPAVGQPMQPAQPGVPPRPYAPPGQPVRPPAQAPTYAPAPAAPPPQTYQPPPPVSPVSRVQTPPAQTPPAQPAQRRPAQPAAQQPQRPEPPPLPQQGARTRPQPATPPAGRSGPQAKPRRAAPPEDRSAAAPRVATPPPAKPEPPKPKPRPRVRPQPLRPEQFLWAYPAEPPYEDEAKAMKNAPAVDSQGHVCLCTQGRIVALVEEEGKPRVLWEYVTNSHVPGPIVVAPDDTIRAHTADGFLHCLSSAGKQVWSPAHVGEPLGWAAPVVDEAGNTFVSAYDGGLIRVKPDGRMDSRLYLRTRTKLDSAAIIQDGVLYVGSEAGYLFAVQLGDQKGASLWRHAADQGYTGGFVNSSPAMTEDGILVVASRDEMLWGFAPSGAVAWSIKVPGQILGSPVIDRHGHIYVGVCQAERGQEGRGFLICVDANSHKIRWQYAAAGPVESTPVIGDDDLIYFGDNAGTIHAVDGRGMAQWTAGVEAAVRSAGTILAPERLAFGLDDDTLVVLKCPAKGLAAAGWPKIARTLGQSALGQ